MIANRLRSIQQISLIYRTAFIKLDVVLKLELATVEVRATRSGCWPLPLLVSSLDGND